MAAVYGTKALCWTFCSEPQLVCQVLDFFFFTFSSINWFNLTFTSDSCVLSARGSCCHNTLIQDCVVSLYESNFVFQQTYDSCVCVFYIRNAQAIWTFQVPLSILSLTWRRKKGPFIAITEGWNSLTLLPCSRKVLGSVSRAGRRCLRLSAFPLGTLLSQPVIKTICLG